jgi:hypothetical protein
MVAETLDVDAKVVGKRTACGEMGVDQVFLDPAFTSVETYRPPC